MRPKDAVGGHPERSEGSGSIMKITIVFNFIPRSQLLVSAAGRGVPSLIEIPYVGRRHTMKHMQRYLYVRSPFLRRLERWISTNRVTMGSSSIA